MALRQLNMRNRQTRHTGSSQCAATANKAPELTPKVSGAVLVYQISRCRGSLCLQTLNVLQWLCRSSSCYNACSTMNTR